MPLHAELIDAVLAPAAWPPAEADGWLVGLLAGLVPAAAAAGAGVQWLLNWLAQQREMARKAAGEDHRATLDEWREIVARQKEQVEALEKASMDCYRRELVHQRAIVYLHGLAHRMSATLRKAGLEAEEVMPLDELGIDFAATQSRIRDLAQATAVVKSEAERVQQAAAQQAPPKPGRTP